MKAVYHQPQEKKYVVTGINKLSGERMAITSPHSQKVCQRMRDALAAKTHRYSAYIRLKVEPKDLQLKLF